ncbi:hypothetical protein J2799_001697 [Chryseobacterium vietnamense]|uniref:hypothetical protein n=1 Tax=Chryseobacterium vietnamense TaxID=866785 RepID=UPI0028656BC2|nr:hypothetical protein [Chryseobacterium vietnamense]MDR6487212.1 hypothetical protein [Chryseobacterium vietnamense]
MSFTVIPNFDDIFPDEKKEDALSYLLKIPKDVMLKSIGFCNTYPLPDHQIFFNNKAVAKNVFVRVETFRKNLGKDKKIEIITPDSYLRLSEIVLSNIDQFTEEGDKESDPELNLFKAFLVLNFRIGAYNHKFDKEQSTESLIDFMILQGFQLNEIGSFGDIHSFIKLIHATIYKVESLLEFLSQKSFQQIKSRFIESFGVDSKQAFIFHMKFLFGSLLIAKINNQFIFAISNETSLSFLKNIAATDIIADEDFTELKKTPLYFLNGNSFSVVNFYFAVDLFYRSAKFRLKTIFEKSDIKIDNFLSYYGNEFSEKFLMKNLLDNIFSKKFYKKKTEYKAEEKNEPDYYVNYNNTVLLFENKDVLISKTVKAANDMESIESFLKERFLQSSKKGVGIKQLVNSIEFICKKTFKFDDTIQYDHKLEIFPILLVHDRVYEGTGINHKLNNWFKEELIVKKIHSNDKIKIHSLTLIDIDTLILWEKSIKDNFKLFKSLLSNHTQQLNERQKKIYSNPQYLLDYLQRILRPISDRKVTFKPDYHDFIKQFVDLNSR